MGFFPRRGQMDGSSCLRGLDSIDFPRQNGMAQPKDFFANVATFTPDEQELIMRGNARQLTFD